MRPALAATAPMMTRSSVVLPDPLGPDDGHDLAAFDRQVHPAQHLLGAEAHAHPARLHQTHRAVSFRHA